MWGAPINNVVRGAEIRRQLSDLCLIHDMSDMIPQGAGLAGVYWLFDAADIVLRHSAPDAGVRQSFLAQILASLQPVLRLLDLGQRGAYQLVATAAGWPVLPSSTTSQSSSAWLTLQGKTVALYTLTDSAARQAKSAIESLVPNVSVELSADHVCTSRLQNLAHKADLFVVATSSAKHAATDCIMRHRGKAPLAYAAGRGFSSFIRAISEFLDERSRLNQA